MGESCGDPDCAICYPMITKTGRVLTPDDLDELADEAARGYELNRIQRRLIAGHPSAG